MKQKIKNILDITSKIVSWILIVFTVFMMLFTIITVSTVDNNKREIFGHKFYIVQTDSMSKSDKNAHMDVHFDAGDIVIVRNVKDANALEPGDIISFMSTNSSSYGETVTHMIREKEMEGSSLVGFVTFGTNTDVNDEAVVTPGYILGEYVGKLPGVGHFFAFVKSTPGYVICILIPFLLLILYNGVNVIRLFRRYKSEQTAQLEAEKAEVAEERRRTEEMLMEIRRLKEQLEGQQGGSGSSNDTQD